MVMRKGKHSVNGPKLVLVKTGAIIFLKRSIVFLIKRSIAAIIALLLIPFALADGYGPGLASHQTLYADTITSRNDGSPVSIADSQGLYVTGNVGIGTTSPESLVHIYTGSAGTQTSSSGELTIEDDDTAQIQFLTPNNKIASIWFGDPESTTDGYIDYDHSTRSMRFGTASTEMVRIDSSGNVGIGDTSPDALLDVAGTMFASTIRNQDGNSGDLSLGLDNGFTNRRIALSAVNAGGSPVNVLSIASDDYGTANAGVRAFFENANVGIGATNPSAKLHLSTTGTNQIAIEDSDQADATSPYWGMQAAGGNFQIWSATRSAGTIGTITDRVRIDSSGRVGIGTTSPESNVEIGDGALDADMIPSTGRILSVSDSDGTSRLYLSGAVQSDILLEDTSAIADDKTFQIVNSDQELTFRTIRDNGAIENNVFFLDNNGNGRVGIGTTSPVRKLQIHANDITSEGSPGIRITSNVAGSTDSDGLFVGIDSGNQGYIGLAESANLVLQTGGVIRMTIGSSGNVGIGPSSPALKLDVQGTAPTDYARFVKGIVGSSASGRLDIFGDLEASNGMSLLDTGNLGIGRTPSTNRLEVEGDASKTTAGDWLANSDARIKTDVREIDDALTKINMLKPVKFRYTDEYRKEHPSIEDEHYYNFIAQEFAQVFPDSVKDSGEGYLQLDTHVVKPYLVAAVQELAKENEKLKDRIEELEKRVEARN